jgi:phosphoglycerol transferase MdoB-like AlkP superfamily enzyme
MSGKTKIPASILPLSSAMILVFILINDIKKLASFEVWIVLLAHWLTYSVMISFPLAFLTWILILIKDKVDKKRINI